MHTESLDVMRALLHKNLKDRCAEPLRVLDVGSRDINGSYRKLMPPAWRYVGSDIKPGLNVDMVQPDAYTIQEMGGSFDVVMCGQTLEHVERPWVLVPEMARMLVPGGILILAAPVICQEHDHPVDCWRFLPGGMRVLLADANLDVVETFTYGMDCWAVGKKGVRT